MTRCWTSAVAAIALFAAVTPSHAQSPLDDLIASKIGTKACFTRVYDADHLRKNAAQKTVSMAVLLSYEELGAVSGISLGLAISRRADTEPLFAQGGCAWDQAANRDTSDRRMIKELRKDAGGGCMMSARPDVFDTVSAEEGGFLIIDRGKDRDTMMVYLQDGLLMVRQPNRAKSLDINFGAADRVFQLRRAPAKNCEFVTRALSR